VPDSLFAQRERLGIDDIVCRYYSKTGCSVWVKKCMEYEVGWFQTKRPKRTWREVMKKFYQAHKLNGEDYGL